MPGDDPKAIERSNTFAVDPRLLLVDEYEFSFGHGVKIGEEFDGLTLWLGTFTGRINNSDERATFNVTMEAHDAWEMFGDVLKQFEAIAKANQPQAKGANRGAKRRAQRDRNKKK